MPKKQPTTDWTNYTSQKNIKKQTKSLFIQYGFLKTKAQTAYMTILFLCVNG